MNNIIAKSKKLLSKHPLAFILTLVSISLIIGILIGRGGGGSEVTHDHIAQATEWTCSMHPQVRLKEPGLCPICSMDLVPVESSHGGDDLGERVLELSPAAKMLAEVETATVIRKQTAYTLRMVGKVEYDETRLKSVATRFPGRLERLFVNQTGQVVKAGQPLAAIYSPELITAQRELLQARKALDSAGEGSSVIGFLVDNFESTKRKLRLWGISQPQITRILRSGNAQENFTINSPLSGVVIHKAVLEGKYVSTGTEVYRIADLSLVWINLEAYESDLPFIKKGQTASFMTDSYPGEMFTGIIVFIDPVMNERRRTVKVRMEARNRAGRLKPGMLASAEVKVHPDAAEKAALTILVPATAPLITGERAIVYVELPGDKNRYEGREIVLGPRAGEFYIVRSGLEEGERVVVKGNFKIDSEMQIRAKPSMMSPEGGVPAPGHHHGAPASAEGQKSMMPEHKMTSNENNQGVQKELDEILPLYFNIQRSLSGDDHAGAKKRSALLVTLLGKLGLNDDPSWKDMKSSLTKSAYKITGSADISIAREVFYPLSKDMIAAVRKWRTSGRTPVVLMFCPMARDNKGAHWLQDNKDLKNPFYGSMMLTCGDVKEVLVGFEDKHKGHKK